MLAHGFFGADKFAGADFATYFYQVKDELAKHGETMVFTPAVDPFNDSTYRGGQLAEHIQQILAQTGYAKVNIIGHSQGGLDARVVAHDHPDWVAAVVTLQTPHHGTPLADVALGLVSDPNASAAIDGLIKLAGEPLWDQLGDSTSLAKPMKLFSEEGIAAFNAAYPDAPGVLYASIAGRSALHAGDGPCAADEPPFIAAWDATLDPLNTLLLAAEPILAGDSDYANDGLLRAKDAVWDEFLGCLPADHLDLIGQVLGEYPGTAWSWKQFYVDLVGWLRQRGY